MTYRRTHTSIRDLIRRSLLDVRMSRAILRKSGIRPGSGRSGAAIQQTSGILYDYVFPPNVTLVLAFKQGVNAVPPYHWQAAHGFWLSTPEGPVWYPAGLWGPSGQHVLTNVGGLAYLRVNLQARAGEVREPGTPAKVAAVPVYSEESVVLSWGHSDSFSMDHWIMPDGRSLAQFEADYGPGGPRMSAWPPHGSCEPVSRSVTIGDPNERAVNVDTRGIHLGRWCPPPTHRLGRDMDILVAVALVSSVTEEELAEGTQQGSTWGMGALESWQIQKVAAPASEAFASYYADVIDEQPPLGSIPGPPGPTGPGQGPTQGGEYPPPPEPLPPVEGEPEWPDEPEPEPGYPPLPEEDMPYP